jgi:hypothetical protein
MLMSTTPRTQTPLLAAAQAQKHITHNEALEQLDTLIGARLLDRDLSSPPASPTDGDTYLVKASATGAWSGHDNRIAYALDGAWRFTDPFDGLIAYVADEQTLVLYADGAWTNVATALDLQNLALLGVNASADSTNKLTVASAAILFDNIGAGIQTKFNKHAAGDTASLLYQTNFSGRAELGLTGDDDLHIKVSPDGSTWYEAFKAARASGLVTLAGDPTSASHAATKQYTDRALARHADNTGALTVTSAQFGETIRIDATAGAATVTLPASAGTDDWIAIRKSDSSANRVTVQNSAGTDIAWLNAQTDHVIFAWWGGAWTPMWWNIMPLVQVFTASGTYTKPPLASAIDAVAIGAGGGGGSGRRGAAASARFGGGGGASGGMAQWRFPSASIGATETVTVASGGAGGAAVTADSTNGNNGTAGGSSSFGVHLRGGPGAAGSGGTASAGNGGGSAAAVSSLGAYFAGASSSVSATPSVVSAGTIGSGGAGGGISTGDVAFDGCAGANGSMPHGSGSLNAGAGGTSGGAGGNGTDIANSYDYFGGAGGGGGGASITTAAGNGGNGGVGAGGGGGGASLNGNASGAGGTGGRGEVRITTYF